LKIIAEDGKMRLTDVANTMLQTLKTFLFKVAICDPKLSHNLFKIV